MLGPTSAASPEPDPIQQPPKRRKTTHAIKQEQLADSGTAPLSDAQCISNAIKGVSVKHEELSVGVQVKVWQETTWRTGTVHSLHGAELYGVRWLGAGDEAVEDMQLKWEHHGIDNRSAHRWFVAMKQEVCTTSCGAGGGGVLLCGFLSFLKFFHHHSKSFLPCFSGVVGNLICPFVSDQHKHVPHLRHPPLPSIVCHHNFLFNGL